MVEPRSLCKLFRRHLKKKTTHACRAHRRGGLDPPCDKKTVAVFMERVLQMLVSDQGPKLKHVSDGPSSQFKNRYMMNFLPQAYISGCEFHMALFRYVSWE